MTEIRVVSWIN